MLQTQVNEAFETATHLRKPRFGTGLAPLHTIRFVSADGEVLCEGRKDSAQGDLSVYRRQSRMSTHTVPHLAQDTVVPTE